MFQAGLVDEVGALLAQYETLGRTATQAAGYQEAIAELHGEISRDDAVSRQLARRQLVWLRGLAECNWILMSDPVDASALANQIVRQFVAAQ